MSKQRIVESQYTDRCHQHNEALSFQWINISITDNQSVDSISIFHRNSIGASLS